MLRGAGEQPGAFENDVLSVELLGADRHPFGAADVRVDIGDAEATFGSDLFTFRGANLGIDEHQRHGGRQVLRFAIDKQLGRFVRGGDVDDGEQERLADLLRCQPEPFRGAHGLQHVLGELAKLGRDAVDALALLAQDRVTVFDDVQNHNLSIPTDAGAVKVEGSGQVLPTRCVLC